MQVIRREPFLLLLLAAAGAGCAAGTPPPDSEENREHDIIALRTTRKRLPQDGKASGAARALEAELFFSDAGKVVARSIRAHGGWDAWLALGSVGYARERVAQAPGEQVPASYDAAGKTPPARPDGKAPPEDVELDRFQLRIDPEGRVEPAADPEALHELFLVSLPFRLADRGLRKEYLGVEIDGKTGQMYERLRAPLGSDGSWIVVYFDPSTYLIRRVFEVSAEGKALLVELAAPVDLLGVKVLSQRTAFKLDGVFSHHDPARPAFRERLTDWRGQD